MPHHNLRIARIAALAGAALLVAAVPVTAQDDESSESMADYNTIDSATLPITIPFDWNLRHAIVDVDLGADGDAVPFMFDTGAPTIITNAALEANEGQIIGDMQNVAGGDVVYTIHLAMIDTLSVGDLTIDQLLLQDGWQEPPNALMCVTENGLFGASSMYNAVWQLDFTSDTINVAASVDDLDHIEGALAVPMTPAEGGISPTPYVQLPVADGELVFIVDTGFGAGIAIEPESAAAVGIEPGADAPTVDGIATGAAGSFTAPQQYVRTPITFGDQTLDVPVVIGSGFAPGVDGNIGIGFLSNFVTTFDWSTNTMYLDPIGEDGSVALPVTPMSVDVVWAGDSVVVGGVAQGGPAAEAGVVPETPVSMLNDTSTEGMTIADFCGVVVEGVDSITTEDGATYEVTPVEGFFDSLAE